MEMGIHKIDVARGIQWVEIPGAGLRILCGCPADTVKHLIKRGLILPKQFKGVASETGPNAILLSDISVQNGEFANLAEFPVLQILYKQGLIIPGHPNNIGTKPLLIGSAEQVDSQLRYIYRGNYGLVSVEEIMETGISAVEAHEMMRIKLKFAFGKIRPTSDFVDTCVVGNGETEITKDVTLRRLKPNVFEFAHKGETITVDLNLHPGDAYECPYPLGFRRFEPEYFAVIHTGEGDGWDVNRPCMSSIITYQGRIYLIDAGPNLANSMSALGIGIDQVDGIFHTHAHDDHFAGRKSAEDFGTAGDPDADLHRLHHGGSVRRDREDHGDVGVVDDRRLWNQERHFAELQREIEVCEHAAAEFAVTVLDARLDQRGPCRCLELR